MKQRDGLYKAIAWCWGLGAIALYYYCTYTPTEYADTIAGQANRKWANELMKRQDGTKQTYVYRDRNGNVNMRGTFTPSKPGSKSGKLELRDGNGNRQGTINVR